MKQAFREKIGLLTKGYTNEDLMRFSEEIFQKLEKTKVFAESKYILAYYSFPGEVYTHDFIEKYAKEKTIILPVVQKDVLVLREYKGLKNMQQSTYGIWEPTGEDFTDFSKIDLAIIPGRVFGRNLNRLGRGKGYYDRLLPNLSAYLIGVSYSFQIKEEVPVEPHDFPMDCIISQDEMIV
ncbi:MAG TPA: 5-formyltetrahydrofolate cyclo-ligase [Dysgonamonadaceae bacterium]|nr:5-formyltetrahydrofolate cyclo-ligase [Dysgonamonadaceae bacterium]